MNNNNKRAKPVLYLCTVNTIIVKLREQNIYFEIDNRKLSG